MLSCSSCSSSFKGSTLVCKPSARRQTRVIQSVRPSALFGFFGESEEQKQKKEEERKKKEAALAYEFERQQEVLRKRRSGEWRKEVDARRGARYAERKQGMELLIDPELPWEEQKKLIEAAAKENGGDVSIEEMQKILKEAREALRARSSSSS